MVKETFFVGMLAAKNDVQVSREEPDIGRM